MIRIKNEILQDFTDELLESLKYENEERKRHGEKKEINIPFVVSTLYQSFQDCSKYKDFISDLKMYPCCQKTIKDSEDDYFGIIDVDVQLVKYGEDDGDFRDYEFLDYTYEFRFSYDNREYNYCQCTPDMKDYRDDKHCCGHWCDASFCEVKLYKIVNVANEKWNGDEHDYWEFEDNFYKSDSELKLEKEKKDTECKIKSLKETIERAEKELAKLSR